MRKKSRGISVGMILAIVISLALLGMLIIYVVGRPYSKVILKAGRPMISATTFFKNGGAAEFVENDVNVKLPGEYKVKLKKGFFTYSSTVVVTDTETPVVDYYKDMTVAFGTVITPMELIKSITEDSEYTIEFVRTANTGSMGYTEAEVIVKDAGGNETRFTSTIHVIDANILPSITVEAGSTVDAGICFKDGNAKNEVFSITPSLESVDFSELGEKEFILDIHSDSYPIRIKVVDTIAPTATVVEKTVYKGGKLTPQDFVQDITDGTAVTVEFVREPDFSAVGSQNVYIKLTDAAGNVTECESKLNVLADTVGPVISGAFERTVYIDGDISLLSGITAVDDVDGEVVVYVDKSGLNAEVVGDYEVTYWAVDESGNRTEVPGLVHVFSSRSDEEKFNQLYTEMVAKLIKEGMTDQEKARAVYKWGYDNIVYSGTPNVAGYDNWRLEAVYALEKRAGDCYTYFAFSKAMFEILGMETRDVNRIKPNKLNSGHWWLLVKADDKWYQFDSTRRKIYFDGCLFTKAQGEGYNKKVVDFFLFDQSLYSDIEIQ